MKWSIIDGNTSVPSGNLTPCDAFEWERWSFCQHDLLATKWFREAISMLCWFLIIDAHIGSFSCFHTTLLNTHLIIALKWRCVFVCEQLVQKKANFKWHELKVVQKWTFFSWIPDRRTEITGHNSQLLMCERAGAAPQVFCVSASHTSLLRDLRN